MAYRKELRKYRNLFFLKIFLMMTIEHLVSVSGNELYRCPQTISGRMFTFRDKCYRFVSSDMHWNEAQAECQVKGGNLVHIKDKGTQDFIFSTVKNILRWEVHGMWIGAHDQRTRSNTYEWVNGNLVTWSYWASGQPTCGIFGCNELCAQMRLDNGGRWHDYRCSSIFTAYRYCCMYEIGPKTPTTKRTTDRPTTKQPTTKRPTTTKKPTTEATLKSSTTASTSPPNLTDVPKSAPKLQQTSDLEDRNAPSTESSRSTVGQGDQVTHETHDRSLLFTSQGALNAGLNAQNVKTSSTTTSGLTTLTGAEIAGLGIGLLCLICLLAILLVVIRRRRRKASEASVSSSNGTNQHMNAVYHQSAEDNGHPSDVHLEGAVGGQPEVTFGNESLQNDCNTMRTGTKAKLGFDDVEGHYEELPYDNGLEVDFDSEGRIKYIESDYLTARSLQENNPCCFLNDTYYTGVKGGLKPDDNMSSGLEGYTTPAEITSAAADQKVCGKVTYQSPAFPAQPSLLGSQHLVNNAYDTPRIPVRPVSIDDDPELPHLYRGRIAEDNFYGDIDEPQLDTNA